MTSYKKIVVAEEKTIADAIDNESFGSCQFPCGKHGTCGKCKIFVYGNISEPSLVEIKSLTTDELNRGIRLMCITRIFDVAWVREYNETNLSFNDEQVCVDFDETTISNADLTGNARRKLGVAIDVGTTTLAGKLFDNRECISSIGTVNPQQVYGADVINRIEAALKGEVQGLSRSIRTAINNMMMEMCNSAGRTSEDIEHVVITGNTTMLYLLTETDVEPLSRAPFEIDEFFGRAVEARILGLCCNPSAEIYLPRCISAFIGADILCSIIATGLEKGNDNKILADIGTNGEIVLKKGSQLICCSTAAGPAFEGATLECGMRGRTGAIDSVKIKNGIIETHVVGDVSPEGICGSGIIDTVAAMLELEIIDETGAFSEDIDEYFLADQIFVSQADIRQVQLAKSAICAGIETLIHTTNLNFTEIKDFLVAGGFGSFVSLENAAKIGLIPGQMQKLGHSVGNASLKGAEMILLDRSIREYASKVACNSQTISLASNPTFSELYMEGMLF